MTDQGTDRVFRIFAGTVIASILLWAAYSFGFSSGKSNTLDKALLAEQLKQRNETDQALQKSENQMRANKPKLDRLEKYDTTLDDLKQKVHSQSNVHEQLKTDIAKKQVELSDLTSRVRRAKTQPVDLPAGHFVVGRDIRAGRYQVTGDSNLIIYGADGRNKVNAILGGDPGVGSYVCDLEDGDKIEANGSDRFHPLN